MTRARPSKLLVSSSVGLLLMVAAAAAPVTVASATAQPQSAACRASVAGDVNGDGNAEVAVGEPGDNGDRGSVHILYGQPGGLVADATGTAHNDQYYRQNSPGVPGTSEAGDRFGTATALADVNGDGCADLIVGAPGENADAGRLTVLHGSPGGLTTAGARAFDLQTLFGVTSTGARLGDTLTTGDLNGDGIPDLAAGVRLDVGGHESAGGVIVLYGSPRGLDGGQDRPVLLTADTPGVPGNSEPLAGFGSAVAVGNFDGDDQAELAVGITNGLSGGAVQVLTRTTNGFVGSQPIATKAADLPGERDRFCAFGSVLAGGDVHGDGYDDLAVADPAYGCREADYGTGAVVLLPGSASGLTTSRSQLWTQDSAGVEGSARLGNVFGESLSLARLNPDGQADLAVGAPGDLTGGSVTVLLGSATGLTTAGVGGTRYHQDIPGIPGAAEAGDRFGDTVVTALVQSRTQASLIIAAPGEDLGDIADAGSVAQLSITTSGPAPRGSRAFTTETRGVKGTAEQDDEFGESTRRWG